jgi:hypothetical protein
MVVVVSLYTIILLAVGNSISSFYKYNAYSFAQSSQVAEARRGINRMVRDIREMTYGDEGSYPLLVMEEHKIGFYSDIDRDDSVEYVEFSVSSTTLEKNIYNATGSPPTYSTSTIAETHTLSTYVQNIPQATSTFVYYDVNGDEATATSTVTDIRYVEVRLIVNVDPIRDPGEFMLRSSSALRNLKDNL